MQMSIRRQIGDALPSGAKKHLLNAIFRAYGGLTRTRRPYEYLFILAHERSGSSLLAMLLGNNPEICGYGETTVNYRSPSDLQLLAGNNLYRLQPFSMPGNERYMMDKLVYEEHLAVEDFPMLLETNPKVIFLIREPVGTLRSMMPSMNLNDTFAAVFYIRRLEILQEYAHQIGAGVNALLLTYEDLIIRTTETLNGLTAFLDLQVPLLTEYEVLQPMKGRTAEHHKKLHIGRVDGRVPASPQVTISERNLQVTQDAYDRCWTALSEVCESAVSPD